MHRSLVSDNFGYGACPAMLTLVQANQVALSRSESFAEIWSLRDSFEVRSDGTIAILPLRLDGGELATQEVHLARGLQ